VLTQDLTLFWPLALGWMRVTREWRWIGNLCAILVRGELQAESATVTAKAHSNFANPAIKVISDAPSQKTLFASLRSVAQFKVSSCSSILLPRYLIEAERRWLAKFCCQTKLGLVWLLCMFSEVIKIDQVPAVCQLLALRFSMHMAWHQYCLLNSTS